MQRQKTHAERLIEHIIASRGAVWDVDWHDNPPEARFGRLEYCVETWQRLRSELSVVCSMYVTPSLHSCKSNVTSLCNTIVTLL
jgi:hypothetical protein